MTDEQRKRRMYEKFCRQWKEGEAECESEEERKEHIRMGEQIKDFWRLGWPAFCRSTAEMWLSRKNPKVPLTADERETLERICVAPRDSDRQYLQNLQNRITQAPKAMGALKDE
jgi:hypothetical protein